MKLKKCPFCGGEGKLETYRFGCEDFDRYSVGCPVCDIWTRMFKEKEESIKRWNRRNGKHETD